MCCPVSNVAYFEGQSGTPESYYRDGVEGLTLQSWRNFKANIDLPPAAISSIPTDQVFPNSLPSIFVVDCGCLDISKDDLRKRLSEIYKVEKNTVSVFGLRTHYGGGKTTGFALIYDTYEDLKKFEPHYRLVRYGEATKIEKASRQQRRFHPVVYTYLNGQLTKCLGKQRKNKGKEVRGTARNANKKTEKKAKK